MSDLKQAIRRPASLLQTMRAVAWSFLGIRRASGLADDAQKLSPLHVVIGGVLGAAVFVALILLLVRWVVSSAVAT